MPLRAPSDSSAVRRWAPMLLLAATASCRTVTHWPPREPYRPSAEVRAALAKQRDVATSHLDLGPMAADVRTDSAIVWARARAPGAVNVVVFPAAPAADDRTSARDASYVVRSAVAVAEADLVVHLLVTGLVPGTSYRYVVWQGDAPTAANLATAASGRFRTLPAPDAAASVALAWGGDVGGQGVCRDVKEGIPIAQALAAYAPDYFIGLGDMIYADGECPAVGRYGNAQIAGAFGASTRLEDFRAHWRYNRADSGLRRLFAGTAYYGIWDDHEVMNDFGPHNDIGPAGVHLLPIGLRAFFEYNPTRLLERRRSDHASEGMYRSFRIGHHVNVIILDTRRNRDDTARKDEAHAPKTMLGAPQRRWFIDQLINSNATWNVIVSSVPLSIPTGLSERISITRGRDGWANWQDESGYENELREILLACKAARRSNLVWITTDVHFGSVFRYAPFTDAPEFRFHEFVTGPMNAGLFPHPDIDTTLNPERLFFYGAGGPGDVNTWEEAKPWFNFGGIRVEAEGTLNFEMINALSETVYSLRLPPS